jgi:hypothetical protein
MAFEGAHKSALQMRRPRRAQLWPPWHDLRAAAWRLFACADARTGTWLSTICASALGTESSRCADKRSTSFSHQLLCDSTILKEHDRHDHALPELNRESCTTATIWYGASIDELVAE